MLIIFHIEYQKLSALTKALGGPWGDWEEKGGADCGGTGRRSEGWAVREWEEKVGVGHGRREAPPPPEGGWEEKGGVGHGGMG